jgi:tripartite-type tricarboxylate transporter receptor subunit TctC
MAHLSGSIVIGFMATLSGVLSAAAQDFPSRPIYFVTSSAPGGGGDVLVRYLGSRVQGLTGGSVLVLNRVGAGGNIATNAVVEAKPDGYTLLLAPSSNVIANKYVIKDTRFDAFKDLTPVATVLQVSLGLVVSPKTESSNVVSLVQAFKTSQKQLMFGFGSTTSILGAQMFMDLSGFVATQVAYKSMPDTATGVAGGEVDFAFVDATLALGQAKQGRLKLLAVTSGKRLISAPEVPTIRESGNIDFEYTNFWAAWAPANTPAPVVSKIADWINRAVASPETKEFFLKQGSEALVGSPETLAALMKQHDDLWSQAAKRANLIPQ